MLRGQGSRSQAGNGSKELVCGEAARATQGRPAGTCSPAGGAGRAAGRVWRARGAGPGPGTTVGAIPLCRRAGTEAVMHLVHTHAHTSETTAQPRRAEQSEGCQCMCRPGSWLAGSVGHTEGKRSTRLCPALGGMTSKGPRQCSCSTHNHTRHTRAARGTQAPGHTLSCQSPGWREAISKQPV